MSLLYNRVRMSTATTGTGTITLGSAITGYFTFDEAGVQNADVVSYTIEDGSDFEIGTGTYTASGTTLTRTVTASKIGGVAGASAINLSGNATVFITARAEDIVVKNGSSGGQTITGGTDSGDDLALSSTSNATKGTIRLGDATTGLFFDEVNERISLGGAGNTFTFAGVGPVGIDLAIHNDEATETCQGTFRYSDTASQASCWNGLRSRGSIASPAVVQNADVLALISAFGYDGTDYEFGGYISAIVDGSPGNNAMPMAWDFYTNPGTQTPARRVRFRADGSVEIVTGPLVPSANDGAALGSTSLSWSDLFLASGAVLNFNAGNYTVTHSAGNLAFSGTVTLPNTGLHLLDTNASHDLIIAPGSDLSADRTLTVTTGDTDITLNLTDPGADRVMIWDESAGQWVAATLAGGAEINGTTIRFLESFVIACSDETTALTTGTAKVTFRMPYAFTLTAVRASVTTAPTGATLVVDINESGTTILSTKLSIDISEKTSTTAASSAVISDTALADDAEITIDIDQIGSTIAGAGLKVTLIGYRP